MRLVFVCLSLLLMSAACQTPSGPQPSAEEAKKAANARKHGALEKKLSEGCGQGGVTLRRNGEVRAGVSFRTAMSDLKSGDRVHLCPGRYIVQEAISLQDLSDVHISGERASLVAKRDFPVLSIKQCTRIIIEGLHIVHEIGEGCETNCLDITDSKDVEVRGCDIDGSGYYGFTVTRSHEVRILDNEIHNCEHGFWGAESSAITVKGNHFHDNRATNFESEIDSMFSNDVLADNEIEAVQ